MVLFIHLSDMNRKKFFSSLKKSIEIPWDKFYPKYKISRTMFFNYLSGRYDIPKNLFNKWVGLTSLENIKFKEIEKSRFLPKEISEIIVDEKLAEIFGVLNGDGHLAIHNYEINVVMSYLEKDYIFRLKKLFENKFGISFILTRKGTAIKLRGYSKGLSNILSSEYRLPIGKKLGRLKIPKIVYQNDIFLSFYLRGLFDTDGSFYTRRNNEPVMEISSADKRFLAEVKGALEKLGFKTAKGKNRCFIYQKESIHDFFRIVKPANSKHLKKYQNYLNSMRG